MKSFKHKLLVMALLIISACAFAQPPMSIVYNVNPGSCVFSDSSANGYSMSNVVVIVGPTIGTLTVAPVGDFTYCAPGGLVGSDTCRIYGCVTGINTFPVCDTFTVVFNIHGGCSLAATLTQDSGICPGGTRHYSVAVTGGTPPYMYQWSDFTNGMVACEPVAGQGTCVSVTDSHNCLSTSCSNNNGCNITVNVSLNSPCGGPLPGLAASITGGTPPYAYYWRDAFTQNVITSGTTNNTSMIPLCNLSPGTYCFEVTDSLGCQGNTCYTLQGIGGCSFTYSANAVLSGSIAFSPSYDSAYTASGFIWDFGNGVTSNQSNPTVNYAVTGYYYVTMSIAYTNGDTCTYSDYVYIPDSTNTYPGCQASFYYYIDSLSNSTYHFQDYSSYNPTSWLWSFGDGTSSTLQNPVHSYNSIGTWTVCLTTTDASGCSSNYCQQLSNVPVQDLEANLFHMTTVTPGYPVWVYLEYYNAGTILVNGTVTYRYPAGTTVNATSLTPASHDVANRLLTFNVGNLLPGTSDYIYIDLSADSTLPLGIIAQDTMWIDPVTGDATPANNVSVVEDSVVGSWDPNDKAVSPKGEGREGVVPMATNELSYRIRFQNTGSAAAQTVQIRDVISNNIDLTSVQVTGASHEHITQIISNELVVTFDHINLPDSGANYAASQGYIDVRAKLKPGLSNGTQIFNTADIYFDFNTPVITNTVVTTLGSFVSGIGAIENFDFALMPNPANSQVSLRGEFEKGSVYELMNQLGQVMLNGQITSNNTVVNINDLSGGVYLIRIKSGDKTGVQKLVVAK